MADKRISQLVERTDIANNDVLPIVASGATTTNKVTVSTLQDWMQDNLDVGVTSVGITIGSTGTDINVSGSPITTSGNITINIPTASATNRGLLSSANWTTFNNKLSSVGLTMPSAFTVSNSPLTANGTIAVTGAGTVSQYIRGDGSLADFPEAGGGGGASVNYYLNGSVSQGTIGGIAYLEMNKTPILGAGTNFTINANGYIASFITDAGDPNLLLIPGGNWNLETYFAASSGGGSPSFYVELYKVDSGGTATLVASNSANPELIAFGTTTTAYFSSLAVPATVLTLTDRLALRYYVTHAGRTITMHTENSNLCQVITTFTTGLTALNGLTAQVQNFATGTSGTDFNISSASSTHTFNLPDASASNRGVVTTGTQTFAGYKIFNGTIGANVDIQLATQGTALNTFIKNINATGQTSIGSNGFGFNNANNIYFSGSSKGGGIIAFNNTGNQTYTLQNASGTLAFTSDLNSYLPLTGGTLTGPLFGTANAQFSGDIQSGTRLIASATSQSIILTPNSGGITNRIEGVGTLPLALVSGAAITMAAGGTTPQITLATSGAVTLTGALNGTSASFTSNIIGSSIIGANGGYFRIANSGGNVPYGYFLTTSQWTGTGTDNTPSIATETGLGLRIYTNGSTTNPPLTLASTGAATFSSSVTATQGIFKSTSGNQLRIAFNDSFYWDISRQAADGRLSFSDVTNGERLTITTAGNVGIGTASPADRLNVEVSGDGGILIKGTSANHVPALKVENNSGTRTEVGTWGSSRSGFGVIQSGNGYVYGGSDLAIGSAADIKFGTGASNSERMRITSGGLINIATSGTGRVNVMANPSNNIQMEFFNTSGGSVGSITVVGGGLATAYNTSSDYRLKEDLKEIKGLEKVSALKVYDFKWKNTEERMDGVLAHELAEVLPYAVHGQKDEVDEDGTEKMQGVDYSKIVPVLIKAIQELKTEIDSLKNQIK